MANTFTKSGLTSEDHHLRMPDGHYQKTPPKECAAIPPSVCSDAVPSLSISTLTLHAQVAQPV